jgi:hypothetical protein
MKLIVFDGLCHMEALEALPDLLDLVIIDAKVRPSVDPFTQATAIFRRAFRKGGWVIITNFCGLAEALGVAVRPFYRLILKCGGVWVSSHHTVKACWALPMDTSSEAIIQTAINLQRCQYPGALWQSTNIVGHAKLAKFLFVGDQINPVYRRFRHWPFHANVGCAVYLHRCLDSIGFDETNAIWTNINHESEDHVVQLVNFNPRLRVIALGNAAEQGLRRRGIVPHVKLPHPQFASRFLRHTFDYAAALKTATLDE